MVWVCPICWDRFSLQKDHCPTCGSDLALVDQRSFQEKLECALEHGELHTAVRAADVLARRFDSGDTIPLLTRALRQRWAEPPVAAAIVRVVGRLGGRAAHDVLVDALDHESMVVRAAAAEWLQIRACLRQRPSLAS